MKNLLTNANYGKSLNEISHIRQTSFNDLYNLIMEHAIDLFTPATLLKFIKNDFYNSFLFTFQ
ncbi:MAG: hypothetical protein J6J11_03350 [Treponema sp.]|nr:hypothetical protein [Clostridia bacterium]MBP3607333.1 hypothetical protein [Treponema sp.]